MFESMWEITSLKYFSMGDRWLNISTYIPKIMEDQSLPDADLLAYPSVEESVAAWNGGFDEARAMAISLGINSVENGGNVPKDFWEKPWIPCMDR